MEEQSPQSPSPQEPPAGWSKAGILLVVGGGILMVLLAGACLAAWFILGGRSTPTPQVPTATEVALAPHLPPTFTASAETHTPEPTASPIPAENPTQLVEQPTADLPGLEGPWSDELSGKIVFACYDGEDDNICIINADGSGRHVLTDDPAEDFYPSLSPDGVYVTFSSRRDNRFEAYRMDADGGGLLRLTKEIGSAVYAPQIGPDGLMVFTLEKNKRQAIYVMDLDSGRYDNVTPLEEDSIDPTWALDGQKISFASDRSGSRQIYWINPDGSELRQLTFQENMGGRHSISPDGRWLTYYAGTPGAHHIYIQDIESGETRQLTHAYDSLAPCFSPDGQWIVFTAFTTSNQLFLMHPDGSGLRQLTDSGSSNWQPRWGE